MPVCDRRCSHWYGPSTEPPWHEPTWPQLSRCCTLRLMSMPLPLRAILMRSPRAETDPCAQHEPQYLRENGIRACVPNLRNDTTMGKG